MSGSVSQSHPSAERAVPPDLVAPLMRLLGPANVITDAKLLDVYSCDFSELPKERFAVIARPAERAQVAEILKLAHATGTPVCVRGGGMSYTQAYLPQRPGSLALDMSALNRVVEVNLEDLYITVEAGCTWQQLYHLLDGTGYHLAFGGTLSGERATVGGALGNNATAVKRGQVVDDLLGLEVVLADGRVVQTGSRATGRPVQPMRNYGPDLTGLFLHDAGVMGVKTLATFRLRRRPAGTEFACFGFQDTHELISAMCELCRQDLITENGAFGEYHNRMFASEPAPSRDEMRKFVGAIRVMTGSRLATWRLLARMARPGGLKFLTNWKHALGLSTDAPTPAMARGQMREISRIVESRGGVRLPPTLSVAMRAVPFHPVERLIVGAYSENNAFPSNRLVSLSRAHELYDAAASFFADNERAMRAGGLKQTIIFACIPNNMFGIEPIIYWRDQMSPLRAHILTKRREELLEIPADLEARELALDLRQRLARRLEQIPGAHYQIGKYYGYQADLIDEATREAVRGVKRLLDPGGVLNPGGLGL